MRYTYKILKLVQEYEREMVTKGRFVSLILDEVYPKINSKVREERKRQMANLAYEKRSYNNVLK